TLFASRAYAQAPAGGGDATGVLLRKIQEQQKRLDEEQKSLAALIRELEGLVHSSAPTTASNDARPSTVPSASVAVPQADGGRYGDGIVIWQTGENAKVPFLLKFNVNTQLRYLNTLNSQPTFTSHLGVTQAVNTRNDITVNRSMFILGGYIFDKR